MKSYSLTERNQDRFVISTIFLASFVFYYLGCIKLLDSGFYEKINIAFDLDQSWYFDLVGRETSDWQFKVATDARPLVIKHPFIYLYHYLVLMLNSIGKTENISVIIISQVFHSASLVISYLIFRCLNRSILEASLLIFGLAGTSTYISTGLVLDIYSLSIFWIALIFLIVSQSIYKNKVCPPWWRAIVSIMAIGTTSYLIILVLLMELTLAKNNQLKFYQIFKDDSFYKQLLRIFSLGIVLFIVLYASIIPDLIQDPLAIIKRTFWTVNRPGEKTGVLQVIIVFSLFSVLSPRLSSIELPEGIKMLDLRQIDFSFIGWVTLVILILSVILKSRELKSNGIVLFCVSWLGVNLLFHTVYQYRGSLFLYCGHFILAVWLLYFSKPESVGKGIGRYKKIVFYIDRGMIFLLPICVWLNNIYLYTMIIGLPA